MFNNLNEIFFGEVTHSPLTSEVGGLKPKPYVEKMAQNLDQMYVLVPSAHKTTCRDVQF